MKTIAAIEPSLRRAAAAKTRVAAYCRVSTGTDDQLVSLETQKSHYEEFINNNPDWEYAGIYYDEGITGTSKEKRPALLRMIADCENGKIENSPLTLIQTHVTIGWSQKVSNLKPWSQTKKRHPAIAA